MTISDAARRRTAYLQRMDAAAPGFWHARFREYDEAHKNDGTPPEHQHQGVDTAQLVSDCFPCAEKRIRWMQRQPASYLRATGERFAALYLREKP